jgi:molybdopterin converting factor small subunit
MKIKVGYSGLARAAAGRGAEEIELPAGADVRALIAEVAKRYGSPMQPLLATTDKGAPAVLAFVGERQVSWESPALLKDGDEVMLLSPIAGGTA